MTQAVSQTSATTRATQPVVACQNLTKVFRDFWLRNRVKAVDRLSFEVHPHEIFGLLGPNGSGKSTTIKLMLGLLHKTSGRIAIFGMPPTDVAIKKRVGYLPEESHLYPFLNARETLEYYAKIFGIDRRTRLRRVDELIDMVGLSGAQFRPVREYSKGMQRRIGLAQALINDPDLLILDEPTTGLDPIGTKQVKDLILDLGRRGKTVILSSHLLADVEDCVDRMVILYGGQKRDEGTCDSLLTARTRMNIETDALDEETIAEIDRIIRQRTSAGSIISVSKPRQRLEDFFLDIVQKAAEEKIETHGATQGGETASFLRGSEEDDGSALIESLVKEDEPEAIPAPAVEGEADVDTGEDVIADLLEEEEPAAPEAQDKKGPKDSPAAPIETSDVDLDIIRSLTGDEPVGDEPEQSK